MGLFNDLDKYLTVSSKWATKIIDCTIEGITRPGGCGGKCERGKTFWPPKSGDDEECPHLREDGCIFSLRDRPVKCLLYPFVIKNGKLVLYGRALLHTCRNCYNEGRSTIFENLRPQLTELFGEEQYEHTLRDILRGKDVAIEVPKWFYKQIEIENGEERKNKIPSKRKYHNQ